MKITGNRHPGVPGFGLLSGATGEDSFRDAHPLDRNREAAVDRHVHDDFTDLLVVEAVVESEAEVDLQLVRTIEGGQRRDDVGGSFFTAS